MSKSLFASFSSEKEEDFFFEKKKQKTFITLGLGILALAVLFHAEGQAAIHIWLTSTAYGHCLLVLPVAIWLAYERRGQLTHLMPQSRPALAALALPLALLWFVAERLGIMEMRQFAALFLLYLLVVACLGVPIARAMAVPLGYLVFLIPFGAFLVPALQDFTARFIDLGLAILGVPHLVTARMIEIPEGKFEVAEACAGLRFLIATIAFGALYACTFYRSPWRRAGYLAACVVVPILANGVRALGIVLVGHFDGTHSAVVVDHVLYGWVFFSIVIVLLLVIGLPFRDDGTAAPRQAPAPRRASSPAILAITAIATLALAATGPAGAAWLDARANADAARWQADADRLAAALAIPPGCTAMAATGAIRHLDCAGTPVTARVEVFGPLAGPAAMHAWQVATAPADDETSQSWIMDAASGAWRLTSIPEPPMTKAASLRLGDLPAPSGLTLRLRLALAPFRAAGPPTIVTTVTGAAGVEDVVRAQPTASNHSVPPGPGS